MRINSSARPARRTSLFGNPTFGGSAGDQKSPLRRCFKPRPLVENECKPVASDRRSGCGVFDPGGCPASCPDAHRPARSHRHVRIRRGTLTQSRAEIQGKIRSPPIFFAERGEARPGFLPFAAARLPRALRGAARSRGTSLARMAVSRRRMLVRKRRDRGSFLRVFSANPFDRASRE
jgi:hypothetical protein